MKLILLISIEPIGKMYFVEPLFDDCSVVPRFCSPKIGFCESDMIVTLILTLIHPIHSPTPTLPLTLTVIPTQLWLWP